MTIFDYFKTHPKAAIAFSGGVDSSFLLYAAMAAKADVTAYYVKSAFQPAFELEDAKRLSGGLGAKLVILDADVLAFPDVTANPPDRCYYCKQHIFSAILKRAEADGYTVVCDGTNASDDAGDRPGMRALAELQVLSPLRECGLTKPQIRKLSKEAGLFTWDKPAYACLATRIPSGTPITAELLTKTEKAEAFLMGMGFSDFRVRLRDGAAWLQVPAGQMEKVLARREEIVNELGKYYTAVTLDLEARNA